MAFCLKKPKTIPRCVYKPLRSPARAVSLVARVQIEYAPLLAQFTSIGTFGRLCREKVGIHSTIAANVRSGEELHSDK